MKRAASDKQQGATCAVPCFKGELVARLRADAPTQHQIEEMRIIFAALADPTRIRIIYALSKGKELCVCDVAHLLGTSVSAASHHLRKLRDLRILKCRNDGKMTYYSMRDRDVAKLVESEVRRTLGAEADAVAS